MLHRITDRQIDRQTDRQKTDRQTDRQTDFIDSKLGNSCVAAALYTETITTQ